MQLGFNLSNGVTDTLESRGLYYKKIYDRNLRIFVIS